MIQSKIYKLTMPNPSEYLRYASLRKTVITIPKVIDENRKNNFQV